MAKETRTERDNLDTVPALEKAVRILDLLEESGRGRSLSSISSDLGIPKSSAHRILATLEAHGYLVVGVETGLYKLGPRLLTLGAAVRRGLNVVGAALPHMETLKDEIQENVKLSVINHDNVIVVAKVENRHDMRPTSEIGARFPLHAGAASKVLLAYQSTKFIDEVLSQPLETYTANTVADPVVLRKQLEEVRHLGYALDREECLDGIMAIACPVFDIDESVVAAISVPFLATANNELRIPEWGTKLRACARKVSQSLGHR